MMEKKHKAKKWIAVIVVVLLALLVFVFVWIKGKKHQEPEYVFFYADNQPEDYPTTLGGKYFAELVEERTGGRIRILVHAAESMGTEMETLAQLRYGGIDFARVPIASLGEFVPEINILSMPYLYNDSKHMWYVLDGEIGDMFLDMTKKEDIIGLSWYDAGVRNFYTTNKPIICLEDVQGMKIRVQESSMMIDTIVALGGNAVPMSYGEVYAGFEQGHITGAENNWPSYESMKHYEVAKYFTLDEHMRVPELQICSKYTWDKLSREDQEIIRQCAKESAIYERKLWTEYEEEARKNVLENGTEEVVISPEEKKRFREAVKPVYEKYAGEYMYIIDDILEIGKNKF